MKIVIVGHEATLTGAPLSALSIARELKRRGHDLLILLRRDGPLREQYEKVAPTYVFKTDTHSFNLKDFWTTARIEDPIIALKCLRNPDRPFCVTQKDQLHFEKLETILEKFSPDCAYVNTSHNGDVTSTFTELCCPNLMHVRELGPTLDALDFERLVQARLSTERAACVSRRVESDLLERMPRLKGHTCIIHPTVEEPSGTFDFVPECLQPALSKNSNIVLGVGTISSRKGTDLFIETAIAYFANATSRKNVQFVWVGGGPERLRQKLQDQVIDAGLSKNVMFAGQQDQAYAFYSRASALLCTSREDPYPRIMIEAAYCGIKTIAFQGAGGSDDFITDFNAGAVVDYLSASAMAGALAIHLDTFQGPDIELTKRVKSELSLSACVDKVEQNLLEIAGLN